MHRIFAAVSILCFVTANAQNYCFTTEMQNKWFTGHPELKKEFERAQERAAATDRAAYSNGYKTGGAAKSAAGTYTIPVVFHILHLGGAENISDAQVMDAMNILTRDFNAANSDTNNVVGAFKKSIGNPQIDFVLATRDPDGNCTNGIVRHWDENTVWDTDKNGLHAYTWPRHRYLNIYVVRSISSGAAGYTYLPGSGIPASMDAIVILSSYVGSIGTGNAGTSRALTHEVGHWLDLPHVWGFNNNPGVTCGDDGVSDTPFTKGFTSCNLANSDVCSPGTPENVQNYMDYAYCQRMFTTGQAIRMQNCINSATNGRSNLSATPNLAFTGVTNPGVGCVPQLNINALPSLTVCSGKPVTLQSFTYNAAPATYSWSTDAGAAISSPASGSTSIVFSAAGTAVVKCEISNASGSATETLAITVLKGTPDVVDYYYESFEYGVLPQNWTIINNTTPAEKWEMSMGPASEGIVSLYVPGEQLSGGSVEILETPGFDFKHNPGAQFSFRYAYARFSATHNDVFKVQASKNCGGTWTDIYIPSPAAMALGSGGVTTDLFLTPVGSEWKQYVLNDHPAFYPFLNEENVKIRFYFQEDPAGFGNRFYLDEVGFSGPVGMNELARSYDLQLYPNPSDGSATFAFTLSSPSHIHLKVMDVTGAVVEEQSIPAAGTGPQAVQLNRNGQIKPGIYIAGLQVNGVNLTRKLVIR